RRGYRIYRQAQRRQRGCRDGRYTSHPRGARAGNRRTTDSANQPVVGDALSMRGIRVSPIGIRQTKTRRKCVGYGRSARQRVDVVLILELLKTPLNRVLARDILQVRIELKAVALLG